jgi:hypothetical protein
VSALRAPIAVAVEVRARMGTADEPRRAFRLARAVGEDGVRLERAAPFEPGRPVEIRFALPGGETVAARAEVLHADGDDERESAGAGGRELAFIEPSGAARAAIGAYVEARLALRA